MSEGSFLHAHRRMEQELRRRITTHDVVYLTDSTSCMVSASAWLTDPVHADVRNKESLWEVSSFGAATTTADAMLLFGAERRPGGALLFRGLSFDTAATLIANMVMMAAELQEARDDREA